MDEPVFSAPQTDIALFCTKIKNVAHILNTVWARDQQIQTLNLRRNTLGVYSFNYRESTGPDRFDMMREHPIPLHEISEILDLAHKLMVTDYSADHAKLKELENSDHPISVGHVTGAEFNPVIVLYIGTVSLAYNSVSNYGPGKSSILTEQHLTIKFMH